VELSTQVRLICDEVFLRVLDAVVALDVGLGASVRVGARPAAEMTNNVTLCGGTVTLSALPTKLMSLSRVIAFALESC